MCTSEGWECRGENKEKISALSVANHFAALTCHFIQDILLRSGYDMTIDTNTGWTPNNKE
jgi:hypothetical protein